VTSLPSVRHLGRRLGLLARQSPAQLADLLIAQATLVGAQLLVWIRPTGGLISEARPSDEAESAPLPGPEAWQQAVRTAAAVRRAASYGVFRPRCLVRSVALNRMLERRGISGSRVRVGVQMHETRFAAHAWVELHGRVLGDDVRHTSSFKHLVDVQVAR
jgi:hypothetical protein